MFSEEITKFYLKSDFLEQENENNFNKLLEQLPFRESEK